MSDLLVTVYGGGVYCTCSPIYILDRWQGSLLPLWYSCKNHGLETEGTNQSSRRDASITTTSVAVSVIVITGKSII